MVSFVTRTFNYSKLLQHKVPAVSAQLRGGTHSHGVVRPFPPSVASSLPLATWKLSPWGTDSSSPASRGEGERWGAPTATLFVSGFDDPKSLV